jgi:CRP/FNR family transcriptional regulator, cyclic AMP receptor protein
MGRANIVRADDIELRDRSHASPHSHRSLHRPLKIDYPVSHLPGGKGIQVRKVLFIFGQMTDGDVDWLATVGERIHVKAGTVLIQHGSRVDHLYFVLDGQLAIRTVPGVQIALLESGEIVGEMSLVDPAPTTVSVEVAVDATLLRLSNEVVRKKLATDMGFASRFYFALCVFLADRMRNTTLRLGYGDVAPDPNARDELNENLLDTVHMAGARFDRMLKRLAG